MEALFVSAGLSEEKAKQTLKNSDLSSFLADSLKKIQAIAPITRDNGLNVYKFCTLSKKKELVDDILPYIARGDLDTSEKVGAAIDYGQKSPSFDKADFEQSCGVGITVSNEDIENAVQKVIAENKDQIVKQRYRFNIGMLLGKSRTMIPFADGQKLKKALDLEILNLLGPKTEEDMAKPKKEKKAKAPKEAKKAATEEHSESLEDQLKGAARWFHEPGKNYETERYVVTENTMKHMENHLKITGGQIRTRFPPEPNGILHIGHAKAINFNFGYAKAHNGVCYLRYDDTNPEKEEEKFFTAIKDMVEWLGYKPWKITHASDNFQQLYELAIKLIEADLAYCCHMTADELKGIDSPDSPWRNRPKEETLALFRDMKNGKIEEGKCTLRMKHVMEDGKKDPVAYRIKYTPHHRTGDEWCIYPTYDFTHCLCDSIEHISHSLCTKEFQARRSSYYWLCNAVDVYCPVQWEYGRLNLEYTMVSKRKIGRLIDSGLVADWDDPRLFTLTALRRRGFPPQAINNFCAKVGITGNFCTTDAALLEHCVRDELNKTAPRRLAVIDPLEINIVNFKNLNLPSKVPVANHPSDESFGKRDVAMSNKLFIERADFEENAPKDFRRLTPAQPVGLKYGEIVVTVKKVHKSGNKVVKLDVEATPADKATKPKAFIHWVDANSSKSAEIRIYSQLFATKDPDSHPDGFLAAASKSSLEVKHGRVEAPLSKCKIFEQFQFERNGYFCYDKDSTNEKPVFNLTIGLKEDKGK
jgi:glutaminyl-tRNA synthetase